MPHSDVFRALWGLGRFDGPLERKSYATCFKILASGQHLDPTGRIAATALMYVRSLSGCYLLSDLVSRTFGSRRSLLYLLMDFSGAKSLTGELRPECFCLTLLLQRKWPQNCDFSSSSSIRACSRCICAFIHHGWGKYRHRPHLYSCFSSYSQGLASYDY